MRVNYILPLVFAAGLAAQQSGPSLADALASQNSSLSTLNSLLQTQPHILQALGSDQNITILAPNNQALDALLNNSQAAAALAADPAMVTALLTYHVLNGTYFASNFTKTPLFIPTLLTNQSYSNVTGGQRVEAMSNGSSVLFFSGLKENSTVVTPNVNFTGGTIHIIDSVLTLPMNDFATATAANLTAFAGALQKADLVDNIDGLSDVTIFAPANSAFEAIGNLLPNLTTDQLTSVLKYHVIQHRVDYSTMIQNGTADTAEGSRLTFTIEDGEVFVNSAKVIQVDVLVANGVVHVIDNVLNPMNTTATPNPSASQNSPAFSGASSTGISALTAGITAPTSTVPAATATTGSSSSSSSSALAVPMATGAVGAAALFGGAVALMNL